MPPDKPQRHHKSGSQRSRLVLSIGEPIWIGTTRVTFHTDANGHKRISIEADCDMPIKRESLLDGDPRTAMERLLCKAS